MTKSKLKTREKVEKIIVNTFKIIGASVFLTVWFYIVCYIVGELVKFTF